MLCEKSFQWVIFAVNLQNNLKPNAAGMDWVCRAIFLLKSIITFSRIQNVWESEKSMRRIGCWFPIDFALQAVNC